MQVGNSMHFTILVITLWSMIGLSSCLAHMIAVDVGNRMVYGIEGNLIGFNQTTHSNVRTFAKKWIFLISNPIDPQMDQLLCSQSFQISILRNPPFLWSRNSSTKKGFLHCHCVNTPLSWHLAAAIGLGQWKFN